MLRSGRRERLALPDSLNLIAKVEDLPVGMTAELAAEGTFEVISLWVAPEARGRGVGDALIEAICDWVRSQRGTELRLDVVASNEHALRLYARRGFVEAGHCPEAGERTLVKSL